MNFLATGVYDTYWANTSGNRLAGKLIREGNENIKTAFGALLNGESICFPIDEQIVYNQLDENEDAVFSLLLASGYLKVLSYDKLNEISASQDPIYELTLTNYEVKRMFYRLVKDWFGTVKREYHGFLKAMLTDDLEAMNEYMNEITMEIFSYFNVGSKTMRSATERFYHGFVLGILVELRDSYQIRSNRESGLGRYDVMLEPKNKNGNAIIIEFKVFNPRREKTLEDTVASALQQIEEKQYKTEFIAKGFLPEQIRNYGFAFEGKNVLIG